MCIRFWMVLFLVPFSKNCASSMNKDECGYKQCPLTKDGALNVHLIPHSHMDAGWVKTFDQYYYGTKQQISTANVQLIYHSILSELLHDKNRKFTLSETVYFWRWWKEQRASTRAVIKRLVQEGRLEFAGGGWVQNDEATSDYEAIIDSYTWGLRILNDTLGPCSKPKAAWQIDTYGHSREQASLLAQMGFDGLFISRVDYKEREAMIEEDRMEFIWRGSDVLGKMTDIMTHTLFNLYNPPEGFCFDYLCNDEPIMEDPMSKSYNADKRVAEFITYIEKQAKYYSHDNIVVMMGGDFTYLSAAGWFINMDKLINHINTHPANVSDINIFYSTPSCYLKSLYLHGKRDKGLFTEKEDLFPYGTDPTTYWTGYFSSRPSLKYLIRKSQQFLQILKQLSVITRQEDSYELHLLRHSVSLAHHHDAITGTSQQHVANDYVRILTDALDQSSKKVSSLLAHLTPSWGGTRRPKSQNQFSACFQLNISQCNISESSDSILLLLYNPSSVKTNAFIRLPVSASAFSVKNAKNEVIDHQIVPVVSSIVSLPGRGSGALQELHFAADSVPPLGYTAFHVTAVRGTTKDTVSSKQNTISEEVRDKTNSISNEFLKVIVNKDTGLLQSVQYLKGVKIKMSQNFYSYSQTQTKQHSGAYSFRLNVPEASPVSLKATYSIVKGPVVQEIRQRFSDWITQIIRLYRGQDYVEFDWIVGPVPVGGDLGKEIVTRFMSNITNHDFYTDSNGRQMMRRTCMPPDEQNKKPIPACYYPVTSRICIRGQNATVEMCILTDRAQGGTSYDRGQIELMVHRRLLTDDEFGLDEALNEEAYGHGLVVRGQHRLVFGKPDNQRTAAAALKWKYEPWLFMASGEKITKKKWGSVRNKRFSALHARALPTHVHVLTLEPWKTGAVLLRLENTRVDNYTQESNNIITLDVRTVFLKHRVVRMREVTLPANQWLDDARQMDWSTRYVYDGGNDDISDDDNTVDYSADLRDEQSTEQILSDRKNPVKLRRSMSFSRFKRNTHLDPSSLEAIQDAIDEKSRHDILKEYIYSVLTGKSYKSDGGQSSEFKDVSTENETEEKALSIENARYEYQVVNAELGRPTYDSDDNRHRDTPSDTNSEDMKMPEESAVMREEDYTFLPSDDATDDRRYLKKDNNTKNYLSSNALQRKLILLADLMKNMHRRHETENNQTVIVTKSDDSDANLTSFDVELSPDDLALIHNDVSASDNDSLEASATTIEAVKLSDIEDDAFKDVSDANKMISEDLFDKAGTRVIPINEYKQDVYYDLFQRRVKRAHSGAFMPFLITWNEENTKELKDLIDEHLSDNTDVKKLKDKVKESNYLPYLRNQTTPEAERRKSPRKSHFAFDPSTVNTRPTEATESDATTYFTTLKMRKTKPPSLRNERNDESKKSYLTPEEFKTKRKKEQTKYVTGEGEATKKKYDLFNDIDKFVSKPYSLFSDTNYEDDEDKVFSSNVKPKNIVNSLGVEDKERYIARFAANNVDKSQDVDMYTSKDKEKNKNSIKNLSQSADIYADSNQDIARYTSRYTGKDSDLNDDTDRYNDGHSQKDQDVFKSTKSSNVFKKEVSRDKRKYQYDAKNSGRRKEYEQNVDRNNGPDKKRYAGNFKEKKGHQYIPRHPDRNIDKDVSNITRIKEKSKRKGKGRVKSKHFDQDIDGDDLKTKDSYENNDVSKYQINFNIDESEPKRKSKKKTGRKKKNSKLRKAVKKEKQRKKKTKKRKKKGKRSSTTELPTTNYFDLKLTSENIKRKIDRNNKVVGMSIEKNDEWMDNIDISDFGEEYSKRRKRSVPSTDNADIKPPIELSESEQIEDYLVTLKPTQIRTFIVWFDSLRP